MTAHGIAQKSATNGFHGAVFDKTMSIIRPNVVKDAMYRGEFTYAFGMQMAFSAEVVHLTQIAGFTGLAMNLEHGRMGIQVAADMCAAALNLGLSPIVIVPSLQSDWISRLLDNGAQAIIVPRTGTAAMARELVRFSKHRPLGERPLSFTPQMQYQIPGFREAQYAQDSTTLTVPMIETVEGLENSEEIAAVPGVDMLFIGTFDLSDDMGIPGELENPKMIEAIGRICKAAKTASTPDNQIFVGLGGCEHCPEYVSMLRETHDNIRFMLAGRDTSMLLNGMRNMVQTMKEIK